MPLFSHPCCVEPAASVSAEVLPGVLLLQDVLQPISVSAAAMLPSLHELPFLTVLPEQDAVLYLVQLSFEPLPELSCFAELPDAAVMPGVPVFLQLPAAAVVQQSAVPGSQVLHDRSAMTAAAGCLKQSLQPEPASSVPDIPV